MKRLYLSCFFVSLFFSLHCRPLWAEANPLTFSGNPMVTAGEGGDTGAVGSRSLWINVGTIQGVEVDMEATILTNSSSTANSLSWSTESGRAKLALLGEGAQRVDVAYRFYISGTNTPIAVSPEAVFRGLDGGLRQEVISTLMSQVASYAVDSDTAITAELVANGEGDSDDTLKFTSSAGANLVTNSGFELGNTGFSSSYTFLGEHNQDNDATADWGEDRYAIFSDNRTGDSANSYFNETLANNGDAFIIIDIGSDLVNPFWQMTLDLQAGKHYVFSAYLANVNDSDSNIQPNVNFVLANTTASIVLAESGDLVSGGSGVTPWQEFTSEFTATGTSHTLQMIANSAGLVGNDLAMDDVVIREVLPSNQVAVQIKLQPANVFYFTFEKSDGLGEFTFDGSLPNIFMDPQDTLVDLVPPSAPIINSPIYSLNATPIIDGTAEPYSYLHISVAGAEFEVRADGMGEWTLDTGTALPTSGQFAPATDASPNTINAVSRDTAGNESDSATGLLYITLPVGANAQLSASPEWLIANGSSVTEIRVQAKDAENNDVALGGSQVVLDTSLGTLSAVTDKGDGSYTAQLTSSTNAGTALISGSFDGQDITPLSIEFVAVGVTIDAVTGDDNLDADEDNADVVVTGTTVFVEDGQEVTVMLNGKSYQAVVDQGIWSVSVPAIDAQALTGAVVVTADVENQAGDRAQQAQREFVAVNDPAQILLRGAPSILEDAQNISMGDLVSVFDAEGDSQQVQLVVSVGTISLTAASPDAILMDDDGTDGTLRFSGTPLAINETLKSLTYTPPANVSGPSAASFTITIDDGVGGKTEQSLNLDVAAVNDAPILSGSPDVTAKERASYQFVPSAADVDGDTLVFSIANQPAWAEFDSASGTLSGTPSRADVGVTRDVIISVSDGTESSALPAFDLTVEALPNAAPVMVDQHFEVLEKRVNLIQLVATDDDQDPLSFDIITPPTHGQLAGAAPSLSYTSAAGYVGEDSFVVVANDGRDSSSEATISLTVLGDLDGDGLADKDDLDDDGDGISDLDEGNLDPDGDGVPNDRDIDSDGDGVLDQDEGLGDSDGDGIADMFDTSSDEDQDGIPDIIEGVVDTDGDGESDAFDSDSDNDGISDQVEGILFPADSDDDGIDDQFDVDTTGGVDANGDGIDDQAQANDQDADGIPDYVDQDSDSDTLPDVIEGEIDSDLDGAADFRDMDSDSDGLPDSEEAGTTHQDTDGDGVDDHFDVDVTGGTDANGDGIDDDAKPLDSDDDGQPNYLDPDSDGDGIADEVENGAIGSDQDGDGIDDAFDVDLTGGTDADGNGIDDAHEPADVDQDGIPNYVDTDSDNDTIPDVVEGVGDDDGDGIPNYLDNHDDSPKNTDTDGDGIPDVVEGTQDSDGDGTPDYLDSDSDNDGAPDTLEAGVTGMDSDNDGTDDRFDPDQTGGADANNDGVDDAPLVDSDSDGFADSVDTDSDNDGLPDAIEFGLTGMDTDDDGIDDLFDIDVQVSTGVDVNGDGLVDDPLFRDTDGDGLPDFRDLDSDNDGVGDGLDNRTTATDSDGDGITDDFDIDVTGGQDANGDGVDDAVALTDTDGDGTANIFDLDSDNDGRLDVVEAGLIDQDQNGFADVGQGLAITLPNSDDDQDEDMFDPDSDNDGVFDIAEGPAVLLDMDQDGKIDPVSDADSDGLDDAFDLDDTTRGNIADQDRDGIADSIDIDDDNDGIPDRIEGLADVDQDGLPNCLDLDSDGDGLSDWFESGANINSGSDQDHDGLDDANDPDQQGLVDTDGDGIADDIDADQTGGADANGDGVDDSVVVGSQRDADSDGIADRLELDADGDGLSDMVENVLVALTGMDLDRDGLDDGIDASITQGIDGDGDGVVDAAIDLTDFDSDGLLAYRDPDVKPIPDPVNPEKDLNGQQPPGKIKTAVRGAGSLNIWTLFALLSLCFMRLRRFPMKTFLTLVALVAALTMPLQRAFAEREDGRSFYFGGGLGVSELLPEEGDSGWNVVDHSDTAYKLFIGYQLTDRIFGELDYSDLGAVGLEPYAPLVGDHQEISYTIPSVSAGFFLLNPNRSWNAFFRAGIGSIDNKGSGDGDFYEKNTSAQLLLGLGAEWKLTKKLFLRAEASSFDKDARSYLLSLAYSLGDPAPVHKDEPVAISLRALPVEDDDQDGIPNPDDLCPNTLPGRMVDDHGCELDMDHDGVLDINVVEIKLKVLFETGSALVQEKYMNEIQALANFMNEYPAIDIEIEGHTDDVGPAAFNKTLSELRAQAVAKTLRDQMGIAPQRITTVGYGESRPLIEGTSEEARRQNRRVVVVISDESQQ